MTETAPWDAKAAGSALFAGVKHVIADERSRALLRDGRDATDAEIARAVLGSPAILDLSQGIFDGLVDEYKPRVAALVAAEAGRLLEASAPAIRVAVAGEIAAAIEASVCEPGDQCAERFCPDCSRYFQSRADAALARRIGGSS